MEHHLQLETCCLEIQQFQSFILYFHKFSKKHSESPPDPWGPGGTRGRPGGPNSIEKKSLIKVVHINSKKS